jgi:hypothetical protein
LLMDRDEKSNLYRGVISFCSLFFLLCTCLRMFNIYQVLIWVLLKACLQQPGKKFLRLKCILVCI